MSIETISETEFTSKVLRSELPVLVDFFAGWCAPCKQVEPEVRALAQELDGKAKVVKVDIDQAPKLAAALRVKAVPTFVVFYRGQPAAMEQGVVQRKRLRAMIEPFIPRPAGAISPSELADVLKQGAVAVDTRDPASYARARIPGAAHIPLAEVEGSMEKLRALPMAVLYCRAGDKTKAVSEKLASEHIEVPFLEGGLLAWEALRLPIERP